MDTQVTVSVGELITLIKWLLGIEVAILGAIIIYGWNIASYVKDIQFKTSLLWQDYQERLETLRLTAGRRDYDKR